MNMKKYTIIMLVTLAFVGSSVLTVVGESGNTSGNDTENAVPLLASENTSGNGTDVIIPLIAEHKGSTATSNGNGLSTYLLPIVGVIGIIAIIGCIFVIQMKKKVK